MALAGLTIGIIGIGVTVWSGVAAYRGRTREVEDGLYSIRDGHGAALGLVIVGALLTVAGLVIGYLGSLQA